MNVAVAGWKPFGTDPPAGPCAVGVVDPVGNDVRAAEVLVVGGLDVGCGAEEAIDADREFDNADAGSVEVGLCDPAGPFDELVHAEATRTQISMPDNAPI